MVGAQRPDRAEQAALSSQELLQSLVRPVRVCTHDLELVEQSGFEESELLALQRPGPAAEELPAPENVLLLELHRERGQHLHQDVLDRLLLQRHLQSPGDFRLIELKPFQHLGEAQPALFACTREAGTEKAEKTCNLPSEKPLTSPSLPKQRGPASSETTRTVVFRGSGQELVSTSSEVSSVFLAGAETILPATASAAFFLECFLPFFFAAEASS